MVQNKLFDLMYIYRYSTLNVMCRFFLIQKWTWKLQNICPLSLRHSFFYLHRRILDNMQPRFPFMHAITDPQTLVMYG